MKDEGTVVQWGDDNLDRYRLQQENAALADEVKRLREALIGARQFLLGVASAIDAALAKEPKS